MQGPNLTDGRIVSLLVVVLLGLVLAIPRSDGRGETRTGSAAWALDLLETLPSVLDVPGHAYDRTLYDQGWGDVDSDCRTTRQDVLVRDSNGPVEFADGESCVVATGRWVDPYTGDEITRAEHATIDHVVPLAEAHRSGAWAWPQARRMAFANDLGDPATLAVVSQSSNSAKGSATPSAWMPEEANRRCAYAIAWVRVKTRWVLGVADVERVVLRDALAACDRAGLPTSIDAAPLEVVALEPVAVLPLLPSLDPECDVRYAEVCIPLSAADLDCDEVALRSFPVEDDPHGFDGNSDGIACEG